MFSIPKFQVDVSQECKTTICHKKKIGHHSLSPGILTTYCPHGISYGFEVLQNVESPRTPFQMMLFNCTNSVYIEGVSLENFMCTTL